MVVPSSKNCAVMASRGSRPQHVTLWEQQERKGQPRAMPGRGLGLGLGRTCAPHLLTLLLQFSCPCSGSHSSGSCAHLAPRARKHGKLGITAQGFTKPCSLLWDQALIPNSSLVNCELTNTQMSFRSEALLFLTDIILISLWCYAKLVREKKIINTSLRHFLGRQLSFKITFQLDAPKKSRKKKIKTSPCYTSRCEVAICSFMSPAWSSSNFDLTGISLGSLN